MTKFGNPYSDLTCKNSIDICVSAQRKGPSVGIFISKEIRFYKAVQNFLKKIFFVNLLINIVYYVYIDLYIHIFIPN